MKQQPSLEVQKIIPQVDELIKKVPGNQTRERFSIAIRPVNCGESTPTIGAVGQQAQGENRGIVREAI